MKKISRFVSIMLVAILIVITLSGCSQSVNEEPQGSELVYFDLDIEAVPLSATPTAFTIPIPVASGSQTSTNQRSIIDFSNARDGYVMVRVTSSTTRQLRVRVTGPSNVIYQYRLDQGGAWEVFPLSDGNGRYNVQLFEQVQGNSFQTLNSANFTVTLKDEFTPFLRPNQFVNFNRNSQIVTKAAELTDGVTGVYPRVEAIYNFVIRNIRYDRTFAAEVQRGMHAGYVPNLDSVLERRRGICFDYASLMTGMLRSLGIPTRLVTGYAGTQFHAWIDVFSETEGWINNVIHFDGEQWNLMDPTFASTGNQSSDVMRFIGDGQNYSPRFRY